ncbi:MAG: 3-beta hydroxysteroid dehydrogenase [Robiginitomaculum sp.]|nr:MAG: 3-beta hydroxysteroid dehydrogenase [Robiginitomaculum sp.]
MRIFITGASGFVGGAAARHFGKAHDITAMSRSDASDKTIKALGVTPVRCALGGVTAEHLEGVDIIIHAAAKVEEWGEWADYWKLNVAATEQLLQIARDAGVKAFIHIGTEASVFYGQHMRDIDETLPLALNSPYPYSRTKAHAEQAVLAANDEGFRTISVRPRMIWGPNDKTILPVVLEMIERGRFLWVDGGKAHTSTTHIDNLVHGIDLVIAKGIGGKAYFVTDEGTRPLREFFTALTATAGITPPDKEMPGWLAGLLARLFEGVWRGLKLKSTPPLTRFAADMMRREGTININKAQTELGYAPVISVEDGLKALSACGENLWQPQ